MKKRTLSLLFLLLLIFPDWTKGINPGYYYFKQISVKEGLPSTVTSIYDDNNGLVWIGTLYGVYRFDGEKLKRYSQHYSTQSYSHSIYDIGGDQWGNVWVFTQDGTSYYNQKEDIFEPMLREGKSIKAYTAFTDKDKTIFPIQDTLLYYYSNDKHWEYLPLKAAGKSVLISKMYIYDDQYFIAQTSSQYLILIDKLTGEIKNSPFDDLNTIIDFYIDSQQRFWIAQYGKGVACYTHKGKLLDIFNVQNHGLSNNAVLDIEERNGQIWLATDGGGVNIITPESRRLTILSSGADRSLPANSVTCLHNSKNNMWIGMVREGVLGMKENFIKTYTKVPVNDPGGMSEKCPLCLLEDEEGIIWMGTDGGGINSFNPITEKFTHYPSTFGDKIVSICPFSDTELLASNFNKGVYIFNKRNGKKRQFTIVNEQVNNQISYLSGTPVNLYTTSQGEIEFHGGYYYRYSKKKKQFIEIAPRDRSYGGSWIFIGEYDSKSYFHNQTHIFCYNKKTDRYEPTSLNRNYYILSAYVDSTGVLWMATRNGLTTLNLVTSEKTEIKLPDVNDIVTSLIMDHSGIMWLGTSGTLYAYFPKEKRFVIFSESDGVLPNDFLAKPVLVTRDDNIYMGGATGLVRINKSLIQHYKPDPPKLGLLETQLNGVNVITDRSGGVPQLEISPYFTSLTIRSKLDGGDVFRKRIYRYHIEGLTNDFIQSSRPYIAIQTLPPGEYRIKVQCTQADGLWSPSYDLLYLTVLSPWWQHPVFITLCISVVLIIGVYIIHRREERIQQKLKEKERQIYKDKVQALININHELRTPLTLLYTPLKQLMNNKQIPYEIRGKLQGTFKQARQMKNIINMILNMRKMEVGRNTIQLTPTLLNDWLQVIINDFRSEFEMRNIHLLFQPDTDIHIVSFDTAQCEIIISNLLMNAYKFSFPDSEVIVTTRLEIDDNWVRIEVKDGGVGLKDENIENLFTRFQQGKYNMQGTGIGLSYAKQLVEMHGGTMGAVNNEVHGATFYFTLPYQQIPIHLSCPPKPYLNEVLPVPKSSVVEETLPSSKYRSIVIVEDDPDLCDYLAENLYPLFETVYKAHDGMEAIPTIVSKFPQLIISDIIMPRMNGFELCKRIKQNAELSYIPVILLTSKVDDPSIEWGYKTGADIYIPKPFDMDLLILQVQNILNNHSIIRRHYIGTGRVEADGPKPESKTPQDEQFIILLNKIISENMNNTELDVNMVAQLMRMSRASLYNKMKTVVGIGVNEYITQQRIRHARHLLVTTSLGIRDISEQIGFMHPRNFSTVFKNIVGESPSEYRKKGK